MTQTENYEKIQKTDNKMLLCPAFCISIRPISMNALDIFAAIFAVHFHYNVIVVTIGDIPPHQQLTI